MSHSTHTFCTALLHLCESNTVVTQTLNRNFSARRDWHKCTLVFMQHSLSYWPLGAKLITTYGLFVVFSTASYRESGVQIQQKMYYGLHVKYPPVLNLHNWICYYVRNTCRLPDILKGSPIIGRMDKAGNIHWSLCKVPLITDRSKQNIQLL